MKFEISALGRSLIAILPVVFLMSSCLAQNNTPASTAPADARYDQLASKLDQVLTTLSETQQELAESRKEIHALEVRVENMDHRPAEIHKAPSPAANTQAGTRDSIRQLQQSTGILQSEVKQHDQTKVESASKYPIKISGMLLSSTNLNDGAVDNVDLPVVALARTDSVAHGSLATTWRQTVLGLDARGPTFWGASSAADVRVDFFGGQPTGGYDTNAGTLRLRTAHVHLDWPDSSVIASLDSPLISPLSPTSYLSVGEPALAWSGNLWSWAPQIELKHSIATSASGGMGFEFGLIDPAATASYFNQALRQANPSESSKQPGYEARLSYALGSGDHALTIGAGGYYGRQKYAYKQHLDSWAGSADWELPLSSRFELSGELYRGRAIAGLGGGTFKDYVLYEDANDVRGLDAEGGWAQLKTRFSPSFEANAAIGQDSAFAEQIRDAVMMETATPYSGLTANRTLLGNIVFRPRAYLLFSLEYRRIQSWQVASPAANSQTLGLAIGYLY